jgi:hypothetical protein
MVRNNCSPTHTDVTVVLGFQPFLKINLHFVGAFALQSGTSVPR